MKYKEFGPKFKELCKLQDKLNTFILDENWRLQGVSFTRALWIECAELIDHVGYKWWKKQEPDLQQIKLEIVDIFHFGLSHSMTTGQVLNDFGFFNSLNAPPQFDDQKELVEIIAAEALRGEFYWDKFASLCFAFDLLFDELYSLYVAKNVLNIFRQEHGYKEGTYRKIWNGLEDNEVLSNVIKEFNTYDDIYSALEKLYVESGTLRSIDEETS